MFLDIAVALVVSITSGIITHYAIKWLDSNDDNNRQ